MSWTDVFPVMGDEQLERFVSSASDEDHALLDELCGVAKTLHPQDSHHLVVCSLFWKNAWNHEGELPEITREIMMKARDLGLVTRFAPWEHYVQPLLDGAKSLKESRPDIVFRVYLAADLEFLVEDFLAVGCEIKLMRGSSIRHNPGAMWRFLALEEKDRWITITDSDRAPLVIHDIGRTEHVMASGLGLWRVPYIFDSVKNGNDPGYYRPIIACQLGARGGLPVEMLMKAFLWLTLRGEMPDRCKTGDKDGNRHEVPIFGTTWPTYGFDEWFLIAVLYPRLAFNGVLTFMGWKERQVNHFFALDIEYVTWANPQSEIFYFGDSEAVQVKREPEAPRVAESPILERMLREEEMVRARRPSLAGPSQAGAPATLVVARYREDLSWLAKVPRDIEVVVYNKGASIRDAAVLARIDHLERLPNLGREPDTYLHHLGSFRTRNENAWTIFCQGDPFPHSPDFLDLLRHRSAWAEVQGLTSGYMEEQDCPPASLALLQSHEWIGGLRVRTEPFSVRTLGILGWEDGAGAARFRDYCQHFGIPRGWSVAGYFLEQCGLTDLAEQAWRVEIGRFTYGAIFAVRNERLSLIPENCLPRMRELAWGHYSIGYLYERLWLHLFGLPFSGSSRAPEAMARMGASELAEA